MGLLEGLPGCVVGTEMSTVVSGLIAQHGGVQGLVSRSEKNGLGATIQSWVEDGPNLAISPDQLYEALGPSLLSALAAKTGISQPDLAAKLANLMPRAVDAMTPNGKLS
jgi:uncharacterized protein YidB (DUF937 family)